MKFLILLFLTGCGMSVENYDAQSKAYCEKLTKAQYCEQSNFDACYAVMQLNCQE